MRVLVRPGERIPTDGSVAVRRIGGQSSADHRRKHAGRQSKWAIALFAGTLNGEGSLVVAVTKAAGDTTLAHIDRLIEDARARRSPTERFVDAFARRYTPAVILLAVAVVVIVPSMLAQFGVGWASSVPPRPHGWSGDWCCW